MKAYLAFIPAIVFLANCGNTSICAATRGAYDVLGEKIRSCLTDAQKADLDTNYETRADVAEKACEAASDSCTDADIKVVEQTSDCWSKLAVCDPNNKQAFEDAQDACTVGEISERCEDSLEPFEGSQG